MNRYSKPILAATSALTLLAGGAVAQGQQADPGSPGPPSENGVEPVVVGENPTCGDLAPDGSEWTELKIEPVEDGTFSDDTVTVVLDVSDTANGPVVDWISDTGIDAVFVKGGPGGNLYTYDPPSEEMSDGDLHAPVNPNNPNDQFFGLSHVSFCYDRPDKGTTTTTTSTTMPDGTTTTTKPDETTTTTVPKTTTTTTGPSAVPVPPRAAPARAVPGQPSFVG